MSVLMEASPAVAMDMTSRVALTGASPSKQQRLEVNDVNDSRFDNSLSPNNAAVDLSRSPSVGETFVSAATDAPLSSSDSSDSDSDDQEEQLGGVPARSPSLNSPHNSATAFDRVPSLPLERAAGIVRPLSPGEGPSGSTSISMSIGSMGSDSGERGLTEPNIVVSIVAEKKGIFVKHSEYEVKTNTYGTTVRRRYKDFVALYTYLLEKYPYRIIPSLPPKQAKSDALLEARRQSLQTWLIIVSMHPVLGASPILITFLSDKTEDHQYRMRVMYEKQVDEFSRLRQDVTLPFEDPEQLVVSRYRLQKILTSLQRLRVILDEQTGRVEQQARDMAEVDLILQDLEVRDVFAEHTFDDMSQSAQAAARQSNRHAQQQRNAVNERIHVLMELLAAHSKLCDRVERGIFADYTKALSKSSSRTGAECGEPAVGRECAFGLQCVRSETALAEKYLRSLPAILMAYAREQSQYHSKMSKIWHQLVTSEMARLC